ncbi:hypothetical protein G6F65_022708 [Rhizopus arrhizus]|nr:hypothetical protein G6F65_022708 [Rhizopus arrhizus]
MTPSGTRIWATRMPLGRTVVAVMLPIGSGKAAIWRNPSAMWARVLSDSVRRSSSAGSRPLARAAATSCSLAAFSSSWLAARASAIASSALFLAALLARIMAREAWRAFSPRVSMACSMEDEDMAASIMELGRRKRRLNISVYIRPEGRA